MRSDKPFIEHIAASITAIESYVAGGRDIFMREQMIRDAVMAGDRSQRDVARALGVAVSTLRQNMKGRAA